MVGNRSECFVARTGSAVYPLSRPRALPDGGAQLIKLVAAENCSAGPGVCGIALRGVGPSGPREKEIRIASQVLVPLLPLGEV